MWSCLLTTQHVKVTLLFLSSEFAGRWASSLSYCLYQLPSMTSPSPLRKEEAVSPAFQPISPVLERSGWSGVGRLAGLASSPIALYVEPQDSGHGNESHAVWLPWRQHLGWLLKPVSSSLEIFLVLQYQSHYKPCPANVKEWMWTTV